MCVPLLSLLVLSAATVVTLGMSIARASAGEETALACPGLETGPIRSVARVIDGETVALDDGTELRLIGALAPRAIDAGAEPSMWPPEIAAAEELRALLLGKTVELAFGGERSDRYGRLQAHAYVRERDNRRWVQGHLLEQGLARAYTVAGNRACGEALLAAERSAREARRGLWAEAAYQTRSADKVAGLARARGTFQLVEGRIAGVAQVRGMIYLNFDADWRHAFSAALRRNDRALLGSGADNPRALEGRLVRVRGWIEQRSGPSNAPTVELSTAGLIEVLDERGKEGAPAPSLRGGRGAGRRTSPPEPAPQPPGPEAPGTQTNPPGLVETGR